MMSIKEIIHSAIPRIPQGMRNAISASIFSIVRILIKNEYLTSEKHNARNRLSILQLSDRNISMKMLRTLPEKIN